MATTPILPSQPFPWSFTGGAAVSTPFNLPTISTSIKPVINATATYAGGATGILTVTGSTDGGSTWAAVTPISGSPASLTASGTISVLQQPGTIYRVERTGGTGSIAVSAGALLSGQWTGTIDQTVVTASFVKPLAPVSLLPIITVAAAFNSGLVGSLALTASTDGGATYGPTTGIGGAATTLTANGSFAVQQQPNTLYRVEGTVTSRPSGSSTLTYNVSGALPPFNMPITSQITAPLLCGFVIFNSGAGSVILAASTDGGQTFSPVTDNGTALPSISNGTVGQAGGFNILQQPNTIYRLEVTFSSAGSLYYLISGGGVGGPTLMVPTGSVLTNVPYSGPGPVSLDTGFGTVAQVQKLYDTMRVPLTDADLSGALTVYKSCTYGVLAADGSYTPTGTAFAKLSIPASAQRAKQRRNYLGLDRLIRAEYADVVSVVDEKGNSLSAAYSFLDPPGKFIINGTAVIYAGTRYVPGQRVTLRDPWVSGSITGPGVSPALTLPSIPASSPAAFEITASLSIGGNGGFTVTASTDGGATYAPVANAMLSTAGDHSFSPVSPAVVPAVGVVASATSVVVLRILRQPNTLYRIERGSDGSGQLTYFVGLLSSDRQLGMLGWRGPVFSNSTGAFTADTNSSGVQCYSTMIEAAGSGLYLGKFQATVLPDLTALGA